MLIDKEKQKLRGGYYTPLEITNFICNWAISTNSRSILEPSCGDGNFIEAATNKLLQLGLSEIEIKRRLIGIELLEEEAVKANNRIKRLGVDENLVINDDFFTFASENWNRKFDTVIGNPPFIRYQNFPKEHRDKAFQLMNELGLNPNKLTNIWVPFLVIASHFLTDNGRLGMVIPAELFQVNYAAEAREFLSEYFERITIIAFEKLVFDDIQQEVFIVLCEKRVEKNKGIRVKELTSLKELTHIDFNEINSLNVKQIDHTSEKWTKYFLEEDEIRLLQKLKEDNRVTTCSEIFDTNVGLVTGRNQFFLLNEEEVAKWGLHEYVIPIVGRSNQLEGLEFKDNDFFKNVNLGRKNFMFLPPDKDVDELPQECQDYIKFGESQNYHTGYKTRIRDRWYITPSRWVPDGFALRQVNKFPKIISNLTNATTTDTVHRIRLKVDLDINLICSSFFNSLTFAFSEITGRSYGGGVMTFEPSEIGKLKIPKIKQMEIDYDEIDSLVRLNKINEALDKVDEALLIKQHGFSKEEVLKLRNIWDKMSNRRINRKRR